MRDSHPFRGIPMGMGTKLFKLMEMGIAQMGIGTLIINVFPFSLYLPFKICISLRWFLILFGILPILLLFGHFGEFFTIFSFD